MRQMKGQWPVWHDNDIWSKSDLLLISPGVWEHGRRHLQLQQAGINLAMVAWRIETSIWCVIIARDAGTEGWRHGRNNKQETWKPSIIIFSKPIRPTYTLPPPQLTLSKTSSKAQLRNWVFLEDLASWELEFLSSLLIHSIIQPGPQTRNHSSWLDNLS